MHEKIVVFLFLQIFIVIISSFYKETFLNGTKKTTRVPKKTLEIECTQQKKISCWFWLLQKCNFTREFAGFLNLTNQFACKFQVDTFFRL